MQNPNFVDTLIENEKRIEWLTLMLLIFMTIYAIWSFFGLPETIPTHFNARGEADGFGSKATIFATPGIALFTYLIFHFVGKMSPESYNYPITITEENKTFQFTLSRIFLKVMNLWTMILMAYITWAIVHSGLGGESVFNPLGLWILIGGLFGLMGIYYWLARKGA